MAIDNGLLTVDLPIRDGDFSLLCQFTRGYCLRISLRFFEQRTHLFDVRIRSSRQEHLHLDISRWLCLVHQLCCFHVVPIKKKVINGWNGAEHVKSMAEMVPHNHNNWTAVWGLLIYSSQYTPSTDGWNITTCTFDCFPLLNVHLVISLNISGNWKVQDVITVSTCIFQKFV